jgi:hypothetical protein
MMTKKLSYGLLVIGALFTFLVLHFTRVHAQTEELQLAVRRNFGYGGGEQIQGNFRMEIDTPPAGVVAVTFLIDGQAIGTDAEPPFRLDFETDAYGLGWHEMTAEAQTPDGGTLVSAVRRFEFVSAEVSWQVGGRIMGITFGLVGVIFILVLALQFLLPGRGKASSLPLGAKRNYGWLGGTVCPKCQRPFPLHWWRLKLAVASYDRCDHCGKWSLVRAASAEQLAAAEQAELAQAQPEKAITGESEAERLRRQLDETRYIE